MLKRFGFDASCLQQGHFFYKKLGFHIRLACILLAFSICEGKMIHFTICWFAKMLGIPVPKREAIKSQSPLYDFFAGMVRFIVPARKIIKWDRFSKEPNIDSFDADNDSSKSQSEDSDDPSEPRDENDDESEEETEERNEDSDYESEDENEDQHEDRSS